MFAAGEGVQRVVNLVEQLLFPLQQPELPLTLLFSCADIGWIAAGLLFAQLLKFVLNASLQIGALVQ